MTAATGRTRAYVFPEEGDAVSTLVARLLPDIVIRLGADEATKLVLSWNLHLVVRRSLTAETNPSADPALLPTDIVYTEAPLA